MKSVSPPPCRNYFTFFSNPEAKILYRWPWRESVASVTACKEAAKVEWRFTQAISSLFTEASQLLPLNFFPFSVDNVHCSLMLMIAKIKLDANFVLQHVELIIRVLDRVRRVGFFNFGSGSGIEKIFRVGLCICIIYQVIWVLWGNEILIGYSPSISLISYTL